MTAPLTILRGLVKTAIQTAQSGSVFPFNDFTLAEAVIAPSIDLSKLPSTGRCLVIGLAADDAFKTRCKTFTRTIPIQVAFQKAIVDPADLEEHDSYLELEDLLREVTAAAADNDDRFSIQRIEALKDDNGTPYTYVQVRDRLVFESYFTAYFLTALQPS